MTRRFSFFALLILFFSADQTSQFAQAGIVLTANAAGSQATTVAGATTETFNSFSTGSYTSLNTASGTLTSPGMQIIAADQYGGAGGTGRYISVGAQSGQTSMTLTFSSAQAYFGMWWSAADALNQMSIYSGTTLLGTFNSATASGALSSAYLGNPNGNQDTGEKFAYLNFFGTSGTTFTKIVFSNSSTATGFESDNWSIYNKEVDPPTGTPIGGFTVPEPPSAALCLVGLASGLVISGRRWLQGRQAIRRP